MCFLGSQHAHNERRTWFVVALTAAMMVVEIAAIVDAAELARSQPRPHVQLRAHELRSRRAIEPRAPRC